MIMIPSYTQELTWIQATLSFIISLWVLANTCDLVAEKWQWCANLPAGFTSRVWRAWSVQFCSTVYKVFHYVWANEWLWLDTQYFDFCTASNNYVQCIVKKYSKSGSWRKYQNGLLFNNYRYVKPFWPWVYVTKSTKYLLKIMLHGNYMYSILYAA